MKTIVLKDHLGILFILDNDAAFRLIMAVHSINSRPNAEGILLFSPRTPWSLQLLRLLQLTLICTVFLQKDFFFSDFWLFSPKGCMKKKNWKYKQSQESHGYNSRSTCNSGPLSTHHIVILNFLLNLCLDCTVCTVHYSVFLTSQLVKFC